jgi:hypothetical protein
MGSKRGRSIVDLIPEDPRDVGLPAEKLTIEEIEPAHLLANEARGDLRRLGFTDDEIDGWAREFVARRGAGDAEELLAWTAHEESAPQTSTNGDDSTGDYSQG